MVDLMPATTISDLIRTVLVTVIDRPAFLILNVVYQVFFNVATAELFSNMTVRTVYYRCQMVIGIFMLFKFAVTILEGIVDPTRITDKKQGAGKIITRIITSLVILALITPINIPKPKTEWERQLNNNGIIFGALYSLQDRILKNNTLGKLILGTLDDDGGETMMHLCQRVYNLLDDVKAESDHKTYLLVAHNGISRIVQSYFYDMTNEEFAHFGIKNCEIREYYF